MHILYYDCFAGISGDMNLAAMIDLGIDRQFLCAELEKLALGDEFKLEITAAAQAKIHGVRCEVHSKEGKCHRTLRDIEHIIAASPFAVSVKETALAVFSKLAQAEARVHNKQMNEIHFHEVGALDAIVDIVGAAICRDALKVDAVWSASPELGGGFTRCDHGLMPVPAPATALLTEKIPTRRGAVQQEATTPTGAAILCHFTSHFTDNPQMCVTATGIGIGHRDNGPGAIPNILRVHLAEVPDIDQQQVKMLECNVDDMTGEMLGYFMEEAMTNGALDCSFAPIQMKKNRPAVCISLLCSTEDQQKFTEMLFRHTTTLGVKCIAVGRQVLQRTSRRLHTPLGEVAMKDAWLHGRRLRSKPEYDECRHLAQKHALSLGEIEKMIRESEQK